MLTKSKIAAVLSRMIRNKEDALCRFCIESCPHEHCAKGECKEYEDYRLELISKINRKKAKLIEKYNTDKEGLK